MPRLEIRPFSAEFVRDAGDVLAARHRAHRAAEPLLPERFEDPATAAAEVETLLGSDDASGTVALYGSRVVGYLLGVRRSDEIWGPNVWIEVAGHAVEEPEDARDLYGAAAGRWVEEGRVLADHQAGSPVFGGWRPRETPDEIRAEIIEDLAKEEIGDLVAEQDGRIVGAFRIVPVELSSMHDSLARPEGAALLDWAATLPEVRGTGAGRALTEASFAWARARGHETMVTDWRVTNLLASRFWPARGFRPTFLRLYRHIS